MREVKSISERTEVTETKVRQEFRKGGTDRRDYKLIYQKKKIERGKKE